MRQMGHDAKYAGSRLNESVQDLWNLIEDDEIFGESAYVYEFLNDKRRGITRRRWQLIPAQQYQNLLTRYMQEPTMARIPENVVEDWFHRVLNSACAIQATTELAGHTQGCPYDEVEDELNSWFGDGTYSFNDWSDACETLDELGYFEWSKLPDGSDGWSDFGLDPIFNELNHYEPGMNPGDLLILINRVLHIGHCRGDLASAFIEGGSKTCSDISGILRESEEKDEVTYYRFLSEVKAFLAKLMSKPIDAKPSKYLIDRGVTKEKLIRDLRNKGVLERHEKILDSTNSDKKKATYTVKYKVRKKNFEDRIHWLYAKYFEKNVNESVDEVEAWHGSLSRFDKFEDVHERGNHGWGTYVTFSRSFADFYAWTDEGNGYTYRVDVPENNGKNYIRYYENRFPVFKMVCNILCREFPQKRWYIIKSLTTCYRRGNFGNLLGGIDNAGITAEAVSKALDKNGIVGCEYYEGDSLNYVIFNVNNVKMLERIPLRPETAVSESVFEDEPNMIKTILDDPEFGPIYNERGGLPKQLNEEDGAGGGAGISGGDSGIFGGDIAGATTEDGSNGQYPAIAYPLMRRQLGTRRRKKHENESVVKRNLIVTEEQFRRIIEATATSPAVGGPDGEGDYTYPVAFSGVDKDDPTVSPEGRKGGFSMQRIPNTDPKVNEGRFRKNDEGKTVPRKCDKCGGDVVVQIHGEPVFVCEKCGKYFGTMPCKR